MSSLLTRLSVQKKLFTPVILLITLLVIIASFYIQIKGTMKVTQAELKQNQEIVDDISQLRFNTEQFIASKSEIGDLVQRYELLIEKSNLSKEIKQDNLSDTINETKNLVINIDALFKMNNTILSKSEALFLVPSNILTIFFFPFFPV